MCVHLGSSPRVRGKLAEIEVTEALSRLIPARAGKTWGMFSLTTAMKAHPRACGENSLVIPASKRMVGSSPRVRGKPSTTKGMKRHERLIPARAGKTPQAVMLEPTSRAHPRACGENDRSVSVALDPKGSSPRVRGKHHMCGVDADTYRLIPARAGKTRREVRR